MKSMSQTFCYEECFETLEEARAEIKRLRELKKPATPQPNASAGTTFPITPENLPTLPCWIWTCIGTPHWRWATALSTSEDTHFSTLPAWDIPVPLVPNKAVRITAENVDGITFPCWLLKSKPILHPKPVWLRFENLSDGPKWASTIRELVEAGSYTHWCSDQPTAPTCVPEEGGLGQHIPDAQVPTKWATPSPVPDWAMEANRRLIIALQNAAQYIWEREGDDSPLVFSVREELRKLLVAPSVPAVGGVREALRSAIEDRIKFDLPDESLDRILAAITPYLSTAQGEGTPPTRGSIK